MTTLGIVSMIFFLSVAWGGFLSLLAYAVKQEAKKTRGDAPDFVESR